MGVERTTKELAASAPSTMKIKVVAPPDLDAIALPLRGSVVAVKPSASVQTSRTRMAQGVCSAHVTSLSISPSPFSCFIRLLCCSLAVNALPHERRGVWLPGRSHALCNIAARSDVDNTSLNLSGAFREVSNRRPTHEALCAEVKADQRTSELKRKATEANEKTHSTESLAGESPTSTQDQKQL